MLSAVEAKYAVINDEVQSLKAAFRTEAGMALFVLIAAALAGVALAAVLAFLIVRSLTKPLSDLVANIKQLAAQDYDTATPHTGLGDELGVLARAQEALREELQKGRALKRRTRRAAPSSCAALKRLKLWSAPLKSALTLRCPSWPAPAKRCAPARRPWRS